MKMLGSNTVRAVSSAVVLVFCANSVLMAETVPESKIEILQQTGSAFAAIAENAIPAVVFIKAEKNVEMPGRSQQRYYNNPFDLFGDDHMYRFFGAPRGTTPNYPREYKQHGQGSGFIITKDGYILTNHHVVGDADKITVKLHDGREFEAERVGSDEKSEVAVIKIDAKDLSYLEVGDSEAIRVGEWALAIGNPFGLTATVTGGLISAKGRSGIGIADYENFIQTDAAINPGNSGGPLLNIKGKVIGINTAIYSQSGGYMGIGFAIPINMARAIKDQLVKDGRVTRGYLGVIIQEITSDLANSFGMKDPRGILITEVVDGSAAEKAGLKHGDIILKMNGRRTDNVGNFRNEIASSPPDTEFSFVISRDGKEKKYVIATQELADLTRPSESAPKIAERLGFTVGELTADASAKLGYEEGTGVVVTEVQPGSSAWQAEIRPGHLITSVNRQSVTSVKEFRQSVSRSRDGVLLRVTDGMYYRYIVLPYKTGK